MRHELKKEIQHLVDKALREFTQEGILFLFLSHSVLEGYVCPGMYCFYSHIFGFQALGLE